MSLDNKYRPTRYEDVLGQEGTIKVLRQFVAGGTGFQQSYLFAGPHGTGKTTLGRILARALLCDAPVEGEPCDGCSSCRSILEDGASVDFIEVDAATNSGKADIKKVLEEIAFTSFSGKRRIYLFDESHQLSEKALDALLKPLEDTLYGSEDKKLVCVFCTTEPEKMRTTILSRCAPTFQVTPQPPEVVAERLALICDKENIKYEPDMLVLVAEITECHVRDALKAVEGVSMLGSVDKANVTTYLHLDLNAAYLDVLENIGKDLGRVIMEVEGILKRVSPATLYSRLTDLAMLAYKVLVGAVKSPAYWDHDRVKALGQERQAALLGYATRFASRPGRPSAAMIQCDLACLHHGLTGSADQIVVQVGQVVSPTTGGPTLTKVGPPATSQPPSGGSVGKAPTQLFGDTSEVVDARAVKRDPDDGVKDGASTDLHPHEFSVLLGLRIAQLDEAESGPKGRPNMDRP